MRSAVQVIRQGADPRFYFCGGNFPVCTIAMRSLLEDVYKRQDLVWFEHSAHGPLGEEPERSKALLREKFLTRVPEVMAR